MRSLEQIKKEGKTTMIKTSTRKITPEMAEAILARRFKNRTISDGIVRKYASEMSSGQWMTTGEPLIFSPDDQLLDGQHRLSALVKSKETIEFICISGILPSAFEKMGQGKKRTLADYFSILGYNHISTLAASIAVLNRLKNNQHSTVSLPISFKDGEETVRAHPSLLDSARLSANRPDFFRFRGAYAAMHFVFGCVDEEKRDSFFNGIETGAGLSANSPELVLRNRVLSEVAKKGKLPDYEIVALMIRAFNAKLHDRAVKIIKWDRERDPFPCVDGFSWDSI